MAFESPWFRLRLVAKGTYDDGYDQDLTFWVQAITREAAVGKAMLDLYVYSDSHLVSVEVLEGQANRPADADVIRDKDRD